MKLIDLFSGAGGLSCGLEMSEFHSVLGAEIHPVYAKTYSINHPKTFVFNEDIYKISPEKILELANLKRGELDLLAGGPPCQGFSINAPVRNNDDKRNILFKEFIRIASYIKPKALIIENVPGIVSFNNGLVVEEIYDSLKGIGYSVDHRILFAGHYGVPQTRFRTIFIAVRDGGNIVFPEPTHNVTAVANFSKSKELCFRIEKEKTNLLKKKVTVWDAISDLPEIEAGQCINDTPYSIFPISDYQIMMRNGSNKIFNHISSNLGSLNKERLKYIPQGGSWRDIPFDLLPSGLKRARRSDHTKRYGRLHPNELCSTILTKCDPHWGSFFHPTQTRTLSVREAARIQSFPDRYIFTGRLTEQFEQVGNAVPPLMAKAIGDAVKKVIS